jgi:hypothetical protein
VYTQPVVCTLSQLCVHSASCVYTQPVVCTLSPVVCTLSRVVCTLSPGKVVVSILIIFPRVRRTLRRYFIFSIFYCVLVLILFSQRESRYKKAYWIGRNNEANAGLGSVATAVATQNVRKKFVPPP